MSTVVDPRLIRVDTVGIQGPAGPPGTDGPGFASRMGNVSIPVPITTSIPLIPSSAYAYTIGGLRGLRVSGGSLTLSIQINGVDVTGLSGLTVNGTAQIIAATALNTINVGDRLTLVILTISGATNLEFTMY